MISFQDALNMTEQETKKYCKTYWNGSRVALMSLINFDHVYAKAKGVSVWDKAGNEYLDFLGGYGSLNTGHNHPEIIEALRQVNELPNILQTSLNPLMGALGKNLAEITPGDLQRCFFGNSGTEAVEASLKLARLSTKRKEIIYTEGSFHGKTLGSLSVTGRVKYQEPFQPLIPGCHLVPFGDAAALREALEKHNAAAFIVEVIQGEGGIIMPPKGYLKEAEQLCRENGTLLIVDEIQTGMGRTGKMFACEHENIEPDIMCIAKSLGGGIVPLGVCISTHQVWEKAYGSMDRAALHTSTFGGNTRAMAAGIAAINVIHNEKLADNAREVGGYLLKRLQDLKNKHPLIKEVRGKGLIIGIEFESKKTAFNFLDKLSDEYLGSLVAGELLNKHKIITAYTLNNPNVIRLEPPLMVTREQVDRVLNAIDIILAKNKSFFGLATSGVKTIIGSLRK